MNKNQLRAELLNAEIKKCYHCGCIIGTVTENFMIIGTAVFSRHQTFDCLVCDKGNFFKPSSETLKKNK